MPKLPIWYMPPDDGAMAFRVRIMAGPAKIQGSDKEGSWKGFADQQPQPGKSEGEH